MKKVINKRHSVRHYQKGEIPELDIIELLNEATKAPSAGGIKAYDYFAISSDQNIKELARIAHQSWINEASWVIVLCADTEKSAMRYGDRGRNLYCIQDATLFGAYLDLLLVEKGYGTCWVGAFDEQKVKDFLKRPDFLRPISFLVVGLAFQ